MSSCATEFNTPWGRTVGLYYPCRVLYFRV